MKLLALGCFSVLLLGVTQCVPRDVDVPPHQVRAAECLDPRDPAYDMNLGEPKCPNPRIKDQSVYNVQP
jgi:hypothetical protein